MSDPADSENRKTPFPFRRVILWVGLACLLQFVVFAAVGIARGYSIQSLAPVWIMLAGILLLMPFHRKQRVLSFLSSAAIIVYALVSLSQGTHHDKGDYLYASGEFAEAKTEYRKEIDTWHHRLIHNHREGPSMLGIALCESQLERFDQTRKTYAAMRSMLRGYHRQRAEEELAALDANLAKVAHREEALAKAGNDEEKALLLFDLALAYRGLNCSKKALNCYEMIQALEIDERFRKQARRFAEGLQ